MKKVLSTISKLRTNKSLRKKILRTIFFLTVYRLLVTIPVPFSNVDMLMDQMWSMLATWSSGSTWSQDGLSFLVMLLWGSLETFSIIAVWLSPFINASIIMQLMTIVIPKLEELQELWEQGTKQIQQYTRYLTFPLALLQSIGMVYFINSILGWVIDTTNFTLVLWSAFVLAIWSMIVLLIGDYITEKWISNGTSLLIFASIVAWMTQQVYRSILSADSWISTWWVIVFMFVIIWVLVVASIFLLKSIKNIPIVYARKWKVEQTSTLPIPLNPVGMIPIIFAIAFTTFPYLIAQLIIRMGTSNSVVMEIARWLDANLNIYSTDQPSLIAISIYFILIVVFTFFYTLIQFNPDKIADNIQKRGWFIPWIRPWEETASYIHKTLMHLCLRGWMWLAFLWIYSYLLYYIPFISDIAQDLWWIPVVVTWSWVIIIVWVVQDLINKSETEILMTKYEEL